MGKTTMVDELATTRGGRFKSNKGGKESHVSRYAGMVEERVDDRDDRDSRNSDTAMRPEKKMVVERIIKKKKLTFAEKKNKRLNEFRAETDKRKGKALNEIRSRLKNKKIMKLEPTLLKDFQEKFETESKKVLNEEVLAAAKRKRVKKRAHYLKKQMFGKFIDKFHAGGDEKVAPNFQLGALSQQVKFMELDLEKEKEKFAKKQHLGVSSTRVDAVANKEISHMTNVLRNPAFKADPLAAIKTHLTNTYAQRDSKQNKN